MRLRSLRFGTVVSLDLTYIRFLGALAFFDTTSLVHNIRLVLVRLFDC